MASFTAGASTEPATQGAEAERLVIVEGIPPHDADETEAAIVAAFTPFGPVIKLTLHTQAERQTAVLVFSSPEVADAAAAFSGEILGAAVQVFRPPASEPTRGQKILDVAQQGTATVLAESCIIGLKGWEALQRLDDKTGVTRRVKHYDEINNISATLKSAASSVSQRAKAVDERYHVSETVKEKAAQVKDKAAQVTEKAMQNKYVAAGASTLSSAFAWTKSTVDVAKQRVIERRAGGAGGSSDPASGADAETVTEAEVPVATEVPQEEAAASGAAPTTEVTSEFM